MKRPGSLKAEMTQTSLITAAARILREEGPDRVTYRNVGTAAGLSGSATGYYFDSIDELLALAAEQNILRWCRRADEAAQAATAMTSTECRDHIVDILTKACVPHDHRTLRSHYVQLVASADSPYVTAAYQRGRSRLNAAIDAITQHAGYEVSPDLIAAVIDGAIVAALSEGRDVSTSISHTLTDCLRLLPSQPVEASPAVAG